MKYEKGGETEREEEMPSPVTADMTRWLRYDVTAVCRIDLRRQTKRATVVRHTKHSTVCKSNFLFQFVPRSYVLHIRFVRPSRIRATPYRTREHLNNLFVFRDNGGEAGCTHTNYIIIIIIIQLVL